MSGPAKGRRWRVTVLRALLPCFALTLAPIAFDNTPGHAQTLTPDLFRPARDGFVSPQDSPLRRTGESSDRTSDAANDARLRDKDAPAKSRIGAIPTYGLPAASGASTSGYDSLNRTKKKAKYYPGQAKPKPPPGPGSRPPQPLPANGRVRLSIPPSDSANKTPIAPAMAGTVAGQPPRQRLKIEDDPFGAIGDYAGSFLIKSAVELRGGFDTNPRRTVEPKGSPFYVIAPEFLAVSEWQRHAVVADLRGSFTGYGNTFPPPTDGTISSAPVVVDRPDFVGHINGRLDVSRDFRLMGQGRLRVATDNPGSPNIQAGLQRYPIYTTLGGTFGVDQNFNRLQLSAGLAADRTVYTASKLTDGTSSTNDDRNYNQFGGLGRVSYDLIPGLKPFGEIDGNIRSHDLLADRNGFQRNSSGGSVRAGSSFEFSRILTGELAIGWAARTYEDPRLLPLQGLLTSASLVWVATPLTTAKFFATTSIDETTVPFVSGVLTNTYTVEVDHDFRRWLAAIGKFTWGTQDYQGDARFDRFYSVSGDLIYKLNRSIWLKGTLRRDWLDSNIPGNSTNSTIVMLGVRLQH